VSFGTEEVVEGHGKPSTREVEVYQGLGSEIAVRGEVMPKDGGRHPQVNGGVEWRSVVIGNREVKAGGAS
jgi:hypothetical protein